MKRGNRGHVSGVKDVYLAPARHLFKASFILHHFHAVIGLSLRSRPFITQGGWVSLGIGDKQITGVTAVLFQSEVEKNLR